MEYIVHLPHRACLVEVGALPEVDLTAHSTPRRLREDALAEDGGLVVDERRRGGS
jgi:hypothetical protein